MAPSALELLQPLRSALLPVPAAQIGICRICHSSTNSASFQTCYQCEFSGGNVYPLEVVPITMSVDRGLVHHHLRDYKDGVTAEDRDRLALRLAAMLAVFLANHHQCLGEWDYGVCVPSLARTAVAAVAERTRALHGGLESVLVATPGEWGRQFSTRRFALSHDVRGDRVLLIDDTYASGASIHSAAAVLRVGGAEVIGPLVLGRHVNPGHLPSRAMLDWLDGRRWDPARCCRCAGEQRDPAALPL